MKIVKRLVVLLLCSFFLPVNALEVNITKNIPSVKIKHQDKWVIVQRNQDKNAVIQGDFAKTSRACPPFCIQPMVAAEGVRTIGERELVLFMANQLKDESGLLIDARTKDWYKKGTIPGSINVPYTHILQQAGADEFQINDALIKFGAEKDDNDQWDFFDAKTLVLWCNGPWCGQSPAAIQGLIQLGYPAEKLLYYRGGMQLWKIFGFNIIQPE